MEHHRKIVIFIASSLDGYIAAKNDDLQWLFDVEGEGDNGFAGFFDTVDTMIMGKRTYDWVLENDPAGFPYRDKECYVYTKATMVETEGVTFTNEDVADFTEKLKDREGKNIWLVGGGELIHSFIKKNLVDELIVTVAPVILGEGVPLFKGGDYKLNLNLKSIRRFNQFAELHYEVKR